MPATNQKPASRKHRPGTNVRQRQAQVSVRLSADELSTLKRIAAQEGLTLPSALREGFLRHAEHCE
jgi:predicted DNA binding CopG/RHH family protein